MLLAIRFFEPLFGALIVVPFFGLPPWLLRFKLFPFYTGSRYWHNPVGAVIIRPHDNPVRFDKTGG